MADLESLKLNAIRMGWLHARILIVDDSLTEAALLKSLLRQVGVVELFSASSPDDAIQLCQQHAVQVIIIDYHLESILNGSELLCALRQKHLIHLDCASLLISGDNSSEVILSSLEAEPDAFVRKPVSMTTLCQNIDRAWLSSQITRPISKALQDGDKKKALKLCEMQIARLGKHQRVEKLWLDLLMESEQWDKAESVALTLAAEEASAHTALTLAQIHLYRKEIETAIEQLNQLITAFPLCIEGYDLLVEVLKSERRFEEAIALSHVALKLTPNSTPRAMQLAKLAVKQDDFKKLTYAGHCLASYLPLLGERWLEYFSAYLYEFETFYFKQEPHRQAAMLKDLNITYQRAKERVRAAQQAKLKCLGRLAWIRLTIKNAEDLNAKQQLMRALAPYYNRFNELPLTIRADAIKPLFILGEAELAHLFLQQLKSGEKLSQSTKQKYLRLINASDLCKQGLALYQTIQIMKQHLALTPERVKQQAELLLERYPLSNQLHFLYLLACQLLKELPTAKVTASLSSLNISPLTSEDNACKLELERFFHTNDKEDEQ
ncbi:response regulator [Thaumasiovibrio subtropicus]|uniref:response regulator n=1 Tax=Thaumasiovibrio subtropicus TaxID=1891207 RepID=UPI000B34F689|nr:response regulator [Thaumasiovibrio subtropicus]